MAIVINGSGTVTGLAVGGLPDGTVDDGTVASGIASSKLTGALPAISGASLTSMSGPSFSAKAGSTLGLSNITWTKVVLNTEEHDTDGCFDTSTSKFTPTKAGYYNVYGSVLTTATKVRAIYAAIYKNGGNDAYLHSDFFTDASSISHLSQNVSALIPLNGTSDYIELYVWSQTNSGSLTLVDGVEVKLAAHWIRSL